METTGRMSGRRGQIIPLFALMIVVLMGITGIAIDLAHARSAAEDIQRAADAAALAGVVYLPDNPTYAQTQAAALATANGYTADGGATTSITYTPDSVNRRLKVTILSKVPTTFLRLVGFSSISVTRSATAAYSDPFLMGAPDHVLGFAPYATHAFAPHAGTYPQGFYLEVAGRTQDGSTVTRFRRTFSRRTVIR